MVESDAAALASRVGPQEAEEEAGASVEVEEVEAEDVEEEATEGAAAG